jgi:poly(3-hydroxyalkanoate) depolymerase
MMRISDIRIGRQRIRVGVRAGDGKRPPLLLLNGLGANIELAQPFVDALAGPRVVIFDVPGVGGAPAPRHPKRPRHVARLAADVLDRLGFDQADVLGVSWGGAIAQHFAFSQRARCRRLVLAATAPGAIMVPASPKVLARMVSPRRYVDREYAHRVAGFIYGGDFRTDRALVSETLRHVRFSSRRGYYLQIAAVLGWSSLPWLWTLRQRTLVMAGRDDPIVPTINARIMQSLIPQARLELLDCGHLFLVTRARKSASLVDEFLTAA